MSAVAEHRDHSVSPVGYFRYLRTAMEEAQKCPQRQWIKDAMAAQKRKRDTIAFEKEYGACSKQLVQPPVITLRGN